MAWQEPIFDRTKADVDFALAKLEEWKREDNPTIYKLKGCLNMDDLNRIENNVKYLSEQLNNYAYDNEIDHKNWVLTDTVTKENVDRLLNNASNLVSAYYQITGSPGVPSNIVTFLEVNNLEKILFDMKEAIVYMENNFRPCGSFVSGQEFFLPIGGI